MAAVMIEGVSRAFGAVRALEAIDLDVHDGEFLTLLGPSGSGKSTLLRLIAGLDAPDRGRINIGGVVVCAPGVWIPPQRRGTGMVFQTYALWPHMTVLENVAFPLEMAGMPAREIRARVPEILELVELAGHERKRPGELSGGEQQRVALARALVGRPSLLLMDESLSNLDARLRAKMAGELRRVQEALGITTLYVTHDQDEALALSDRVAVIHRGVLRQVGTPGDLYHFPLDSVVAMSLGAVNLLVPTEAQGIGLTDGPETLADRSRMLGLRPEHLRVAPLPETGSGATGCVGRVTRATFMGDRYHCWIEAGPCTLQATIRAERGHTGALPARGDRVRLIVDTENWIILEPGEEALAHPEIGRAS